MRKEPARIMRDVLAAIIGSRISASEMRDLADLLRSDSAFAYQLADSLWELSMRLSSRSASFESELFEVDEQMDDRSGLVGLVYEVVQRKRLSKARLAQLMHEVVPDYRATSADQVSVKQMISDFLSRASSDQVQRFMSFLGFDFLPDTYLGMIDDRRAKRR